MSEQQPQKQPEQPQQPQAQQPQFGNALCIRHRRIDEERVQRGLWFAGRRVGMAAGEHAAGEMMASVSMYSTAVCPYCQMAERLLRSRGVTEIAKIRVDLEPERRLEMMQKTGRRTVPQIYIGEHHVGGYDDMAALDRAGELDRLLAE